MFPEGHWVQEVGEVGKPDGLSCVLLCFLSFPRPSLTSYFVCFYPQEKYKNFNNWDRLQEAIFTGKSVLDERVAREVGVA